MKKCMLCGWDEADESAFTCPACGEATWGPGGTFDNGGSSVDVQVVESPSEETTAPVKRGPGRPRKTQ